jgi:hypothetical protein
MRAKGRMGERAKGEKDLPSVLTDGHEKGIS